VAANSATHADNNVNALQQMCSPDFRFYFSSNDKSAAPFFGSWSGAQGIADVMNGVQATLSSHSSTLRDVRRRRPLGRLRKGTSSLPKLLAHALPTYSTLAGLAVWPQQDSHVRRVYRRREEHGQVIFITGGLGG
jgi:hypothetical protein